MCGPGDHVRVRRARREEAGRVVGVAAEHGDSHARLNVSVLASHAVVEMEEDQSVIERARRL